MAQLSFKTKILKVENLDFFYGSQQILKNINLKINKSEFVGIIGPNGAGKSTLLKILDGILKIDKGNIYIEDDSFKNKNRRLLAKSIAYLPQETEFTFSYTVHEVVRMGRYPYIRGISYYTEEDEKIIRQAMKRMDIEKFINRSFNELSGGEKQRVMIASALTQQPKVLLLDEPTSALDIHHQIEIYRILKSEQENQKLTIIVVTHDINLASQYCGRIILMDKGKILDDGSPAKVLQFKTLQDTFGVDVYIDINPFTKSLYILPYG
jgi:iron complex transport system ATP-binding protein